MKFRKTLSCHVTICAKIGWSGFMLQVKQLCRRPFPIVFIEISSKRIKVGVAFIFCHLVDVMALCHTSKVFESSLNNLKLFLLCLPTQQDYSILYFEGNKNKTKTSFGAYRLFSGLRRARSLDVISYSIEKEIFPKLPHLRWDNFEHILVLF